MPVRLPPRSFSPRQVAEWVGASTGQMVRWCDEGRIDVDRTPGGHRRIPEAAARRLLAEVGAPLPAELLPVHRRVLALVPVGAEAVVTDALLGAAPLEVATCSYAATVSFVGKPAQYLLLDGDIGTRAVEMVRALVGKRGLLAQSVVVLVGVHEEVVARRVVRVPRGAMDEALQALRRMLRPA